MKGSALFTAGLVFIATTAIAQQLQLPTVPCVKAPQAFPSTPFQLTIRAQLPPAPATSQKSTREAYTSVLQVPAFRFAVIDSIALKGTHPPEGYLAIELLSLLPSDLGGAGRHFLYAKDRPEPSGRAIYLRQSLRVYAAANTNVSVGLQSSLNAQLEPLAVTVTGMLFDCSQWGTK